MDADIEIRACPASSAQGQITARNGSKERASPEVRAGRCIAHKKTGERCKNAGISGSTVCRFHGGAAKHVKAAARARLENAADLMAKQLLWIAINAESEAVKLAAIRDALDRAGLKPPAEVVLSQGENKPYEEVFEGVGGGTRAESRRDRGVHDAEAAGLPAMEYSDLQPEAEPRLGRYSPAEADELKAGLRSETAVGGGVCQFLYWQKGVGIPSSAAFGKIGDAYVAEVPRSASRIAKSDLTVRRVYTSQHLGVTSNWVIGDFRSVEEKGCELRACLRRHRGELRFKIGRDLIPHTAFVCNCAGPARVQRSDLR